MPDASTEVSTFEGSSLDVALFEVSGLGEHDVKNTHISVINNANFLEGSDMLIIISEFLM